MAHMQATIIDEKQKHNYPIHDFPYAEPAFAAHN